MKFEIARDIYENRQKPRSFKHNIGLAYDKFSFNYDKFSLDCSKPLILNNLTALYYFRSTLLIFHQHYPSYFFLNEIIL
jgi:hypothetical protein